MQSRPPEVSSFQPSASSLQSRKNCVAKRSGLSCSKTTIEPMNLSPIKVQPRKSAAPFILPAWNAFPCRTYKKSSTWPKSTTSNPAPLNPKSRIENPKCLASSFPTTSSTASSPASATTACPSGSETPSRINWNPWATCGSTTPSTSPSSRPKCAIATSAPTGPVTPASPTEPNSRRRFSLAFEADAPLRHCNQTPSFLGALSVIPRFLARPRKQFHSSQ
jgi:hypothetical protein